MKHEPYQIIAINPGSTSTKVAVFDDDVKRFSINVSHSAAELKKFAEIVDQLDYRKQTILTALEERKVDLYKTAAFSGRCTGLLPMPGACMRSTTSCISTAASAPAASTPEIWAP